MVDPFDLFIVLCVTGREKGPPAPASRCEACAAFTCGVLAVFCGLFFACSGEFGWTVTWTPIADAWAFMGMTAQILRATASVVARALVSPAFYKVAGDVALATAEAALLCVLGPWGGLFDGILGAPWFGRAAGLVE